MDIESSVLAFRTGQTPEAATVRRVDFSDPESQRALTEAARALAAQLGRQAAREYFSKMVREVRP